MTPAQCFKRRYQRWAISGLVLVALGMVLSAVPAGAAEQTGAMAQPGTDFNRREAALIEARIHAHAGEVTKSMAIYRHLRAADPTDREVQIEYCDFLVDQRQYELAQDELTDLLANDPADLRAQHLQARLYGELTQYGWSAAIYDRLLQFDPNDTRTWSDYAGARLGNTQWAAALNNYSRVLELDPGNRDVRKMVQEILKTHGPRLDADYRRYNQLADDTRIDTLTVGWSAHVSEATRLFVDYRHIDLAHPQQPYADGVNGSINDVLLKLEKQFNQRWSAMAGIGGYNGASRNASFLAGIGLTPATGININAEFQANRPWTDPVDAVENSGTHDLLRLSLDWNDGRRTGLLVQGEDWRYGLDGADPYGRQHTLLGMLSWRLLAAPELVVGYSYYRAWFDYADDDYRPVAMVEDQGWHAIFGTLVHHPWAHGSWSLSGGIRYDHVRSMKAWFFQPAAKLTMGNRLELEGSYDYSSESTGAVGGETQTFQVGARLYF